MGTRFKNFSYYLWRLITMSLWYRDLSLCETSVLSLKHIPTLESDSWRKEEKKREETVKEVICMGRNSASVNIASNILPWTLGIRTLKKIYIFEIHYCWNSGEKLNLCQTHKLLRKRKYVKHLLSFKEMILEPIWSDR